MSLQILGGRFSRFCLKTIESKNLRPTSVMLRRKVFDAHQNLTQYHFIDCFAGSGAVGIEAMSRGASSVVLVEKNHKFFKIIQENIDNLCAKYSVKTQEIVCENNDILKYIQKFKAKYIQQDQFIQDNTILFWDPPYENHQLYYEIGKQFDLAWYRGFFWIESDKIKGPTEKQIIGNKLKVIKKYQSSQQYILICSLC